MRAAGKDGKEDNHSQGNYQHGRIKNQAEQPGLKKYIKAEGKEASNYGNLCAAALPWQTMRNWVALKEQK